MNNWKHLKSIAEGLWEVRGEHWMGVTHFPLRMTVIQLSGGGLLLHSPIELNDELIAEIKELGEVQDILAPSLLHHLFAAKAKEHFPHAKLWGAHGLEEKRSDVQWDGSIETELPEHWRADLEVEPLRGCPTVNELVFLHKPSRSLLLVDLVFNLKEHKGFFSNLIFRIAGVHRRMGQSKLWRWVFTDDREAAGKSVAEMMQWSFERMIPCHGEVVEENAKARTVQALSWMLGGEQEVKRLLSSSTSTL